MRADVRDNLAFLASWRSGSYDSPEKVKELVSVIDTLCETSPGPKVTVDIPVGILSTAVTFVSRLMDRLPEDDGYCQWPVSQSGEWGDGTCGRRGYGQKLPMCWQHADALIDAAYDLIENHGQKLNPYPLIRMLEAINRAQPFGLDSILVERINGLRYGTYQMDATKVVGGQFESAIEQLLLARIEDEVESPYYNFVLTQAVDELIKKRLQENWGTFA